MRSWRSWHVACGVLAVAGCQGECGKTPVPFKRDPAPVTKSAETRATPVAQSYADATREVTLAAREVSRVEGSFRASLDWDLDGNGSLDAIAIATDSAGKASFETWIKTQPAGQDDDDDEAAPTRRGAVALTTLGAGCVLENAALRSIGPEVALASLDIACAGDPDPAATVDPPATNTPPNLEPPAPEAPPDPAAEADAPAEPGARTVTVHQFAVTAEATPRLLLHLAALPPRDTTDTTTLTLAVASQDQDDDEHADVLVNAELAQAGSDALTVVPLLWLNRPSGLARDRAEPEASLAGLIDPAYQTAATDPIAASAAATQVLDTYRVLCHESGAARVWVDETVGLSCGASVAAGKAAVIRALALAKQQQLLPALQARSQLDSAGYRVEAKDRERVNVAIAGIRGQTSYVWERGPDFVPPSTPAIRIPALGFATEDQLLLRGGSGLSYDLRTRTQSPSSLAQGVVMYGPGNRFAIVDMVRDCAGQYLRTVPSSSIVSGFVAGGRGEDLPLYTDRPAAAGCRPGVRRPDRSGWIALGVTERGALLAQGAKLQLVPFDAEGKSTGIAALLAPGEPAPPLSAAGAISGNGLRHALPTSEGVALVQRGGESTTTLIRSPASCTGKVTDVAISPSGRRVAMLCSGRVYWAHETQTPAAAPVPGATATAPSP